MLKHAQTLSAEVKQDLTPMIDVVFLLLIFFMCATKFKQVEQRLDAFLPIPDGLDGKKEQIIKAEELTVFVRDDAVMRASADFQTRAMREATYYLASRDATPVRDVNQLYQALAQIAANPEASVLIALYDEPRGKDQLVPFFNVVKVIDLCKLAGIGSVKFQAPAQVD